MEIAFSDETTTEARFLRTSREFSDFIHGSLAIYLEQVAIPPFWIVHRKLTLGNYSAVHEAVNAQQGLEALETIVSVLLILNNGHAWVYVNEGGNVYLSHAVAQAL